MFTLKSRASSNLFFVPLLIHPPFLQNEVLNGSPRQPLEQGLPLYFNFIRWRCRRAAIIPFIHKRPPKLDRRKWVISMSNLFLLDLGYWAITDFEGFTRI